MGTQLETDDLKQFAVFWLASPNVDKWGKKQVRTPKEIPVRWEWGLKLNQVATEASEKMIATVYVDREITIGSILWKGRKANLPSTLTDLVQVLDYKEIPDIKGLSPRRLVMVGLYSDTLPTIDYT